ncbi:Imm1 family immunity protein [Bacillus sp. DX4.1]|uniref:Imm1 family immunity protein n=1 Tax=Bacillus sp. DX4.1 TaxID=3055867 RepID=UPI0025A28FBB|nr:Imm1 family immunity protein [Bacillus sp. DX4.1]MDM5186390.1 Imm1 family immunity protein [Bacillus sp. DX4.1]
MIIYNGPVGETIENPSERFIRDVIFDKDESYWNQGSGDSCFETEGCEERLILFYDEPYGFFIMRHPEYIVTLNKNVEVETVEHLVGGEPMKMPTCSYVDREMAYRIIEEFITVKSVPKCIEWVNLYDIDFEHGF